MVATQYLVPDLARRVDLRGLYPGERGNPVFVRCPAHTDKNKPNLAVYPSNTYCFVCGFREKALEHIMRVRECSKIDALEIASALCNGESGPDAPLPSPLTLNPSTIDSFAKLLDEHPNKIGWLCNKYGLLPETIREARIGWTGFAYTIPVFDYNGKLVNIRYRVDEDNWRNTQNKYWHAEGCGSPPRWYIPPGVRWPLLANGCKKVALVEGEFDALAMVQAGGVAISCTSGCRNLLSKAALPILGELTEMRVYICYDADAAGREASRRLWRVMRNIGIESYRVTWSPTYGKDISELVKAGYVNFRGEFQPLEGVQPKAFSTIFQMRP